MEKLLAYIDKHILYIILAVFTLLELCMLLSPHGLSWDGSVYVGMGKYLYSHGTVGLWETLRPVGFPVILGLLWKIGINPYIAGQVIALLGSLLCLTLVAKIGNKLRPMAGIYASAILSFAPLFFSYATIPMTDILSASFALACVYLMLSYKKHSGILFSGLLASLAFLFRFPQGLVFVVSGLVLLYRHYKEGSSFLSYAFFKKAGIYVVGFCALAVPFFVANYFAYGDALLPLKAGAGIITNHVPPVYHHGPTFYIHVLTTASPFIFLALLSIALFILRKELRTNTGWVSVMLFLFVYLIYFSGLEHKEMRYALAFLPIACVLAGAGIALVVEKIGRKNLALGVVCFLILLGTYSARQILLTNEKTDQVYEEVGRKLEGAKAVVLSSAPFIVSNSDARVPQTIYDDWREVPAKYELYKNEITHVLLDSCTLEASCASDPYCKEGKEEALKAFTADGHIALEGKVGRCEITLYEMSHE